jgi:tetratricopeptide (TPR) repeat protein
VQGPGKKDPVGTLRTPLIDALMGLPFINALSDRRMLLTLIRQEVVRFPDVEEKSEARLHVIYIVLACLGHPGGLRALRAALETMAPHAEGTRRIQQLIESATLANLLPESELERAHELARQAGECDLELPGQPADGYQSRDHDRRGPALIEHFDALAAERTVDGLPPALVFLEHLADQVDRALAGAIRLWVDEQCEWLELQSDLRRLRARRSAESSSERRDSGPTPSDEPHAAVAQNGHATAHDPLGSPEGDAPGPAPSAGPDAMEDHASVQPVVTDLEEEVRGQQGDTMPPLTSAAPRKTKLPQVWGDVPPRNPNFTGRASLLKDLHSQLAVERETAVLPHSLHGMGGVGKSQVAIEYVHRHRGDYDLIWWIPAEHPSQILSALTDLAHRLELDVSREAISAVPAVREALSTSKTPYEDWLLVFDNAESLSDVRPFFPTGGAGKILVTSRNPEWAAVTRSLEVDVFSRAESKAFLIRRTPELSESEADRLAEALGDLPLAVEQAAAWRVATGMPVGQYLRLLEEKRIELLELGTSPDYEISVAAAWNVSLDRLEEVNGAALQLLQVCSFFAPEPISRELFAGSPIAPITESLDDTLRDPIRLARAIRDIQRYALAKFDHRAGTLQMHRLVQAVLVSRMDPQRQEVMRYGAHTLLASGDPNKPSAPDSWTRYQALLPHVTVSKAVLSTDPRVHQFVLNMVRFLYYWGDHDGCRTLAAEVHNQRKLDLGEDHQHTLEAARWHAWILWVLGSFREAADINKRTLELSEAAFGPADEGTLDSMTRVAIDRRTAGDVEGALALDRRAFEGCTREFGEDDPVTLNAAFHLGVSLKICGHLTEALALDTDTYRRRAIVLGEYTDDTLRSLNYLTIAQREAGDYRQARSRQEDAYEVFVKVFGTENPATTRAARNLAVARRKAGDHDGALKLAEDTLRKFRNRYGDDYPDSMAAALNYAIDLRHAGDLRAARALGEQTLERYEKVLGEQHPHTHSARANLAIVLRLLGDPEAARQSDVRTLDALQATLGVNHPISLVCATNLASDLTALGEHQAAFERDTDTLDRCRRTFGDNHPSTLACSLNLALDLKALGRTAEADKVHADTMDRFRRVLGDRHPATLNALQSVRADCDIDPMPL